MTQMKAVVLTEAEGPGSARLQSEPRPEPGPGEVRVRLCAASLNHRELWISRGQYPGMNLPSILGADGSGVIDALGDGVDGLNVGDDVVLYPARDWGTNEAYPSDSFCLLGMPIPGTLAEYLCVPAANVAPRPAHLSHAQAAAFPTAAVTAWRALTVKAAVRPGDRVLITGIGGGVATFALSFAVAMGADVWVTSGTASNIEQAVALGAKGGFDYHDEAWGKAARKASGGFDVVIDGAPAGAYAAYGRAIAMGARIVIYGSTQGPFFKVNAPEFFLRHATIHGTAMGSPADFSAMLDFVAKKGITPVIQASFPLDDIAGAFDALQDAHFGKVVVEIAKPGSAT
ncbi:alcohol dehydrogenase catalytic domain-containing protein [Mesobacterium pallidum]|uniref:alcohol dehydrogenase catalytic domain-containing protein n=1 Tax=Mesobacterium pallidum TaxID=2872037 RepID=UPI001EE31820|nr:zinc-binding dehydrogenase [Mesobacterium pallidum]